MANLVNFDNFRKAGLSDTEVESIEVTLGTPANVSISFVNVIRWGRFIQVDLQVTATRSVYLAEIASGLPIPQQRVDFYTGTGEGSNRAEFFIGSGTGGTLMANLSAGQWNIHFCYIDSLVVPEDPEMELF